MVYIPLDYNCKKAQNICENMAFIDKHMWEHGFHRQTSDCVQLVSLRMRNIYREIVDCDQLVKGESYRNRSIDKCAIVF
jgi:hypothetical protein